MAWGWPARPWKRPLTGDQRVDLSEDERFLLANGRAWCLVVHSDLGHGGRRNDPIVLTDARRHVELAQDVATRDASTGPGPDDQGPPCLPSEGTEEALGLAQASVDAFAVLPDNERSGQSQGTASLAVLTLALLTAASGDTDAALNLGPGGGSTASAPRRRPGRLRRTLDRAVRMDPDALSLPAYWAAYQGLYSSCTCYADVAVGSSVPPSVSG